MDIELALLQACGHGTRIFGTAHGSNANTSTGTWLLATEGGLYTYVDAFAGHSAGIRALHGRNG